MYIDKSYYTTAGYPTIDDALFNRLNIKAQAKVDRATQQRISTMATIPTMVKNCICEIISLLNKKEADANAVQSFSNDGYSESYAEPLTNDAVDNAVGVILLDYLSGVTDDNGTPLLWLGIDKK